MSGGNQRQSQNRMPGVPKDVKQVIRRARKHGWRVETTGSTHLRWVRPDGTVAFSSALTPRNGSWEAKTVRFRLRREGLHL